MSTTTIFQHVSVLTLTGCLSNMDKDSCTVEYLKYPSWAMPKDLKVSPQAHHRFMAMLDGISGVENITQIWIGENHRQSAHKSYSLIEFLNPLLGSVKLERLRLVVLRDPWPRVMSILWNGLVVMKFGWKFTDLHSSPKGRQPQKSWVSLGKSVDHFYK